MCERKYSFQERVLRSLCSIIGMFNPAESYINMHFQKRVTYQSYVDLVMTDATLLPYLPIRKTFRKCSLSIGKDSSHGVELYQYDETKRKLLSIQR